MKNKIKGEGKVKNRRVGIYSILFDTHSFYSMGLWFSISTTHPLFANYPEHMGKVLGIVCHTLSAHLIKSDRIASPLLDLIHGGISQLDELLIIGAMVRVDGNANT